MTRISNMPPASAADVQGTDSTYLFDANGVRKDKRLTIDVLAEVVSEGLTVAPSSISTEGAAEGQALILTGGAWTPATIPAGDGGGTGDVAGPASAADGRLAVFSGTTGKALADGGYTVANLPVSGPTQTALDAISSTVASNATTAAAAAAAAQSTADTAATAAATAAAAAIAAQAAADAAQGTADGAASAADTAGTEITELEARLAEMELAIAALQNAGTFGTFLDPMWSIATGSGPGEVTVSISSFPLSSRQVNSIGYLMDGVGYSVPIAASFTIQTNTPGVSEAISIRVEESIAVGGAWSDPKSATSGAAVTPSAFDDDDWDLTPGSGTEQVTVEILSTPYDGGSPLEDIEIQYNSTGSWISIGGAGLGTYNVAATGISGAATGRLRAVNAVGNGATPSPTKPVTIPGGDTAPAQFAANQWSFGPGTLPGSYALNIIALPGDGGSAITALEYTFDAGSNWTALTGTGTGERQLTGFASGAVNYARIRAVNAVGNGAMTAANKQGTARTGSALVGGVETEANGNRVHTLSASGDVVVHGASMLVNYEFNGGGGGGGYGRGGGGGGAEIKRGTLTLAAGTHSLVLGAGGVAASVSSTNGGNGGTTTFGGVSALGGGGGAGAVGTPGNTGGSGGGGRGGDTGVQSNGGAASGTFTNAGGNGFLSSDTGFQHGGGGGGAGSAGGNATQTFGGVGGNGSASTAPGVSQILSGGGGGARNNTVNNGALGGDGGTTGGQGSGGATSGNVATAGQTPGSGGGGGLSGTRLPAAGAAGVFRAWYAIGEVVPPANIIVTTPAQLTTALTNAPTDTASRYIIGLAAGFATTTFTYPANYNKGSTCVQIRSEDRTDPATFERIRANNSRNVEFVGLEFIGAEEDVFGFPGTVGAAHGGAVGLELNNARGVDPWYVKVRNCYFDHHYHICHAENSRRVRFEYNTFCGYANDAVRIFATSSTNSTIEDVVFDHCYFSPISQRFTFPDVSSVVGWTVNPACASDARRSDGWQREANSTILDINGVARTITAATKAERHCDAIQSVRTLIDVQILDCEFVFPDQYCHLSILQTNASHFAAVAYSTGFQMRRCSVLGAHSMMPGLIDFIDPIVHTCLYRRVSPLNWSSGNTTYPAPFTRQLDRSGLNPSSRVLMTNCVLPANTPTTADFLASKVTQVDVTFSNSAVPTGWAATDVALGKTGAYGYEN